MANQHKDDANQNQHNQKAMGASATANAGARPNRPDAEMIEGVDAPEGIGGERPNRSNSRSPENPSGERLDLKGDEQFAGQPNRQPE